MPTEEEELLTRAAVDNSNWDGAAAMKTCKTAADYKSICAGQRAGDTSLQKTWALPHHKRPGAAPNAAGTKNALSRLPQTQGLINKAAAQKHLDAHMKVISPQQSSRPPRDDLVRAMYPGGELRWVNDGGMPTMFGHFAVFNQWTEISSLWEGNFMERIAPGSFEKTFKENRQSIRTTFQHGRDPVAGDKVLGSIDELKEDEVGAYYEVPLLDTSYNRDILPGLEEGLYGSSFRFRVMREEIIEEPKASDENPKGLPERTIREVQVFEFGPVTFPAYADATAGVRSLTDEFVFGRFLEKPERLLEMAEELQSRGDAASESVDAGTESHLDDDSSIRAGTESHPDAEGTSPEHDTVTDTTAATSAVVASVTEPERKEKTVAGTLSLDELLARQDEIRVRLAAIDAEAGTDLLGGDEQKEWDELKAEFASNDAKIVASQKRHADLEKAQVEGTAKEAGFEEFNVSVQKDKGSPYDLSSIRGSVSDREGMAREVRDRAMRVIEIAKYPAVGSKEDFQTRAARLVDTIDTPDALLARRIVYTGDPTYERAFWKKVGNPDRTLTAPEQQALERAMTTATEGAVLVPYTIDPTIIGTSNGAVNPLRQIARVESIVTNTWKGVTSAGITAAYATEATEASDNAPTLVQPEVTALRAQAFVPFSLEVDQDYGQLRAELTRLLAEAKDELEATQFVTGTGIPAKPQGVITGVGTSVVTAGGSAAFAVADLYKLEEGVPPRSRPRAKIIGNKFIFNKVRQLDTYGGASLWVRLTDGQPPELIGYPAYECSAMAAALTTGQKIMCMGDFQQYLIVDRVGMGLRVIPDLVGSNHRPTGQSGLFALWRNSAVVLNADAFRVLVTG